MSLRTVKAANAAMNIAGKSAVVIGGTSGIGQAIAIRLAEAGVSVTVVGRNPTRGNQTVAEMTQKGLSHNISDFEHCQIYEKNFFFSSVSLAQEMENTTLCSVMPAY